MFCTKCGSLVGDGERFCVQCGYQVKTESVPAVKPIYTNATKSNTGHKNKVGINWVLAIVIISGLVILISGFFAYFVFIYPTATIDKKIQAEIEAEIETATNPALKQTAQEFKGSCEEFAYEDLARNPQSYDGKPVKLYGEVVQVTEQGDDVSLRVNVTEGSYGWEDTVYIDYTRKSANESRILENDLITLWGSSEGTISYETVLGNNLTIPHVLALYIDQGIPDDMRRAEVEPTTPAPPTIQTQVPEPTIPVYRNNYMDDYYMIPQSSVYYLDHSDVAYLSGWELRIARNEIYARHGRMFTSDELQTYFDNQAWYYPSIPSNQFSESLLSEVEKYNIDLIKSYE